MTSSPFAARLGTNYCPSDRDVLEINSLLAEPTLRLKNLDDEIADSQKAIDKLAAERKTIGAFVDADKALISPARRLPLDIIEAVFIACLPTRSIFVSLLQIQRRHSRRYTALQKQTFLSCKPFTLFHPFRMRRTPFSSGNPLKSSAVPPYRAFVSRMVFSLPLKLSHSGGTD